MTALLDAPRRSAKRPVLLDHRGEPVQRALRSVSTSTIIKARYDAAQTTAENARLWSMADGLSAVAANSPGERRNLRNRARYEHANNSYLSGMVRTLVTDVVGTGPMLQLLTDDPSFNEMAEQEFAEWSEAIRLPEKLRTMRSVQCVDGESFGMMVTNPTHGHPVTLDLRLYEADQVAQPFTRLDDPQLTDGITLDSFGDPLFYSLLDQHPGDVGLFGMTPFGSKQVPAAAMCHLFRMERAGQVRGVPEITPSIPLFAELRRFILAVVAAAETAADFAAVLESNSPPMEGDEGLLLDPFSSVDIERRLMTALPAGYKLSQFKAEQPTTTFAMFVSEIIGQAARPICMPRNVALGNSAGMNFASGKLDHRKYDVFGRVSRGEIKTTVLNRIFREWWREAVMLGLVPPMPADSIRRIPRFDWRWPSSEPIDEVKSAQAQAIRLANRTTNLSIECARDGLDRDQVLRGAASDNRLMDELGLTAEESPAFEPEDDDDV